MVPIKPPPHSLYHVLMYACKTTHTVMNKPQYRHVHTTHCILLTCSCMHARQDYSLYFTHVLMYACKTRLLTVFYSHAHVCMQDKTTHCTLLTCSCMHARQDYSLYFTHVLMYACKTRLLTVLTHMLMYACKTHPVMTKQFTVTARTVSTRGFAGVSHRVITCTSPSPSIR